MSKSPLARLKISNIDVLYYFFYSNESKKFAFCYFLFFVQRGTLDPEKLFTKQERVGKGSFGEVYKGIDNRSSEV